MARFGTGANDGEISFTPAGFASVKPGFRGPSGPDTNRAISDLARLAAALAMP